MHCSAFQGVSSESAAAARMRLGALRTHLAGDGGAAKAPAATMLSAADHEFFAEQGYCVVKSAVPTHVCEAVKREAWEYLAKHHGVDRDDDSTWSAPLFTRPPPRFGGASSQGQVGSAPC